MMVMRMRRRSTYIRLEDHTNSAGSNMTQDLLKDIDEIIQGVVISELGFFQDENHTIDLSVKTEDGEDVFFVRRNKAVLYAGPDGAKAASQFYSQIAQVHEDDQEGADPDFATLREILEARNQHVKEALEQLGHKDLSRSLNSLNFKSVDSEWADIFITPSSLEDEIKDNALEKHDTGTAVTVKAPEDDQPLSDNLIYTEDDRPEDRKNLESPSSEDESSRKPNIIMRQNSEDMAEYKGVFFFIKNSFEEILFVKRRGMDFWELPGGLKRADESIREGLQRQIAFLNLKSKRAMQLGTVIIGDGNVAAKIFSVEVSGEIVLPPKYEELQWVSVGSIGNVVISPEYGVDELKDLIAPTRDDPSSRLYLSTSISNDIYKQRDLTDTGDPFQSVGDIYTPRGVRGGVSQTREIGDNLKHLRNQVGLKHYEESKGVYKYPDNNPRPEGESEDEDPGDLHVEDDNPYIHKSRRNLGLRTSVKGESAVWGTEPDSAYVEKFDTQGWDPGHAETLNDSRMQHRGVPQERIKSNMEKGDDEGIGSKRTLAKINDYSQKLINMFQDNEEIDYWILDKISRAGAYMSDVYHHLADTQGSNNLQQKAYPFNVNRKEDEQDPISAERKPGEPGQEAFSSAETGNATQAFSSGAVIDLPEEMDDEIGVQPMAAQGAGAEGTEGGGDGSVDLIPQRDDAMTKDEADEASEFDSRLRSKRKPDPLLHKEMELEPSAEQVYRQRLMEVNQKYTLKEGGGGGGGAGGGGAAGGFGGDGGGGGTAMTAGGSSGSDATHTATYGGGGTPEQYDSSLRPKSSKSTNGSGLDKSESDNDDDDLETIFDSVAESVDNSLEKNAEVYGTQEGLSQLPAPDVPELGSGIKDGKKPNSVDRHKPGDSESRRIRGGRGVRNETLPLEQEPLGDNVSNLVIAEHEDTYKPAEMDETAENEIVRRKFIDEDSHRLRTDDMAAEQYTNLSGDMDYDTRLTPENQLGDAVSGVVSNLLSPMLAKSGDTPENLDMGVMKALVPNKLEKQSDFMDTANTLVVAGWGNYYVIDQEGHRIGLEGMRKALENFLARPEYANVNIFHSGIQVGQIIPEFTDEDGKIWKTEVRPEGLFVVAAIRTDLEVARKAMREIMKGTMRGFSIAGNAKEKELKCDHGKCWTEVTNMEMYEVTLCVQPMNQNSYITDILQIPDQQTCPDCYEGVQVEYDSNLNVKGIVTG